MIIERQFEICIDTSDVAVIYSTDPEQSIKNILTQMFCNKCYKKCYVLEITKILDLGPFTTEDQRNGGSTRNTVSFQVRALVYDKYEVIPDAKIIEIMEDGKILLRSKYAAIMLASSPKLQQFRIGQVVPVLVNASKFIPLRNVITVQGIPFVPLHFEEKEWTIDITEDDQKILAPLYIKLSEARDEYMKLAPKVRKSWEDLLDPSRSVVPKGYRGIDIQKVSGYVTIKYPLWVPIGDVTTVYVSDPKSESKSKTDIHRTKDNDINVLRGYINQMMKTLLTVTALATEYEVDTTSAWQKLYRSEKSK